MKESISKNEFKTRILQCLHEIEQTGKEFIITSRGKPVFKVMKYEETPEDILKSLRNSVIKYDDPTLPVGVDDWEAMK